MNEKRDTFSSFHPVISFLFYAGAFILGMMLIHPAFLLLSAVMAASYYLTVKGRRGIRFLAGMVPMFVALSLINPLFNTYGNRVLFTWMGGRPYTVEALCYGMALAATHDAAENNCCQKNGHQDQKSLIPAFKAVN